MCLLASVVEQIAAVLARCALHWLGNLEKIAADKGGIRQLLDEKWRKVYRANAPRGLFTRGEMRAA